MSAANVAMFSGRRLRDLNVSAVQNDLPRAPRMMRISTPTVYFRQKYAPIVQEGRRGDRCIIRNGWICHSSLVCTA